MDHSKSPPSLSSSDDSQDSKSTSCANRAAQLPWFGIRTRSNQEKIVATALGAKGFQEYLPVYSCRRRRSDRVVTTERPLFPGYVFCRFDARQRVPIMATPGVVSIIGFGLDPAPIEDREIEAVRAILRSGLATEACPFLREGQRVRIRHGSLQGLEGILVKKKSDWRLVVSVMLLQRSVSVEIDGDWISAT
jgi:transcription antitermination factor NusG